MTAHNGRTHAIALGRRLMRVLPEDAFDRQPLIGDGGRYVLIADVRLDNRDELTRDLLIPASQARTLCDAAILLAAIERWDEACLERLVGDYAFAAWDTRAPAAPAGTRPIGPAAAALSSRATSSSRLPVCQRVCMRSLTYPMLPTRNGSPNSCMLMPETGPQSFFLGIDRVEPGHVVTITANGIATRRHWQPSRRRIELPRPEDYSEALRELLDKAVSCRLRGTGDVGALFKRWVRQWSRGGNCGAAAGPVRPARHRVYWGATRRL